MSVPTQTTEELLSLAQVSAVIACSGYTPDPVTHDFGVDLGVRRVNNYSGKRIDLGVALDLQLKATINWSIDGTEIVYDMDADAYNRLVIRNLDSATPCLLVVCCLPKEQANWVDATEASLVLRKCSYYFQVGSTQTPNKKSVRLKIPRKNLLTPSALTGLVNQLFNGGAS